MAMGIIVASITSFHTYPVEIERRYRLNALETDRVFHSLSCALLKESFNCLIDDGVLESSVFSDSKFSGLLRLQCSVSYERWCQLTCDCDCFM